MVTHVLHFLARRLDKEEQFFLIFYVHVSEDTELALDFFKKSILVKEIHFPFILVE